MLETDNSFLPVDIIYPKYVFAFCKDEKKRRKLLSSLKRKNVEATGPHPRKTLVSRNSPYKQVYNNKNNDGTEEVSKFDCTLTDFLPYDSEFFTNNFFASDCFSMQNHCSETSLQCQRDVLRSPELQFRQEHERVRVYLARARSAAFQLENSRRIQQGHFMVNAAHQARLADTITRGHQLFELRKKYNRVQNRSRPALPHLTVSGTTCHGKHTPFTADTIPVSVPSSKKSSKKMSQSVTSRSISNVSPMNCDVSIHGWQDDNDDNSIMSTSSSSSSTSSSSLVRLNELDWQPAARTQRTKKTVTGGARIKLVAIEVDGSPVRAK